MGIRQHPYYGSWAAMNTRCYNENQASWKNYGGRGITVCEEWRHESQPFISYCEENLPPRQAGESLDRIDTNGNYEPGNIRWSTRSVQNANQRPRVLRGREGGKMPPWVQRTPHRSGLIHYRGTFCYNKKRYRTRRFHAPEEAYEAVIRMREELGLSTETIRRDPC